MGATAESHRNASSHHQLMELLVTRLKSQLKGQDHVIELSLAAFLGAGHLLLEGPPGVGKTRLAKALSDAADGSFRRIQMTSDLLPGEIVGIIRPSADHKSFEFRKGPIFANILLADELNRTSPKTQAALLEAMAEGTVTVDGTCYPLPDPFFVVATQNPLESHGVYPLAESQLDRFMLQIEMHLPDETQEKLIYLNSDKLGEKPGIRTEASKTDKPVLSNELLIEIQQQVQKVFIEDSVVEYAFELIQRTRDHGEVEAGVSVRGGLQFLTGARSLAYIRGRDYVTPQDVRDIAVPALAHRIHLADGIWEIEPKRRVVRELLKKLPSPK